MLSGGLSIIEVEIGERILTFIVGVVFIAGGIKFIILALDSQRASIQAITMGIIGFVIGLCLAVWAFTGPPG